MYSKIPLVRLSDLQAGGQAQREAVRSFGDSLETFGFVRVGAHPISSLLVNDAYRVVGRFFDLELEAKLRYEVPQGQGQRGYTRFGVEHAQGRKDAPDLKEFWHVGRDEFGANLWPEELPEFRSRLFDLRDRLDATSVALLGALEHYYELPVGTFADLAQGGNSILRLANYPVLTGHETSGAERSAEHGDINLITLLLTATEDGLEIRGPGGDWLRVNAAPNEIIVNVADMLERITNGRLRSVKHRVVNPGMGIPNRRRLALPYFVHPKPQDILTVAPRFRGPDMPIPPPDISGADCLQERLRAIGLAV